MASITPGVFFRWFAPSPHAPHPAHFHILGQQFPSSFGDRVRVQVEKVGDLAVSTQLERFQASVQTPLLFIEQAGKQHNRCSQFIGRRVSGFGGG